MENPAKNTKVERRAHRAHDAWPDGKGSDGAVRRGYGAAEATASIANRRLATAIVVVVHSVYVVLLLGPGKGPEKQ